MAKRQDVSKLEIQWDRDPREVLSKLQRAMRNKISRKAIRKASTILAKQVRKNAPKDKSRSPEGYPGGALKKVTGTKVYTPKRNKEIVLGIVGARSKFTTVLPGVKVRGANKGQPRLKKPSKYQHLANKGRNRGRGGVVPATDYLEKSMKQEWPSMERAMKNIIGTEIINTLA